MNISTDKDEKKSLSLSAIATEMYARAIKDVIDDKLRQIFAI